jgi:hypothetical protein
MVKRFEYIFIFIVVFVLSLPLIQSYLPVIKEKKLSGYFEIQAKPDLIDSDYFSGKYQEVYMKYLNDNLPIRSNFIRLFNQLQYSLFTQTNASDIVIGKDNYLFEKPYLKEISGNTFIGVEANKNKIYSLKKIQDYLNLSGKKLIVIFAAGKASYYYDKIPSEYATNDTTNYEYLTKYISEENVNFIDFRKWVISMKDTTTHNLMGKAGIQWTNYTGHLVADSINRYIENLTGKEMSKKKYISIEHSTVPRGDDNDIERAINLIYPIDKINYQYPVVEYIKDSNAYYPNVSVVADSYWWTINNLYSPNIQYNKYYFMYYFKNVYDKEKELTSNLNDEEFKTYIDNSDIVILMATEANYSWFPYGFIEKFNKVYNLK